MRYRFGECVLTLASRELMRGSETNVLAPQVFDLLAYLIRHRERVVSKDELIETIWGGRAISDAALTTRVYAARSAIGDSGREQRYIKTYPRRGVRFVGHVQEAGETFGTGSPAKLSFCGVAQAVGPRWPSITVLAFKHIGPEPQSGGAGEMISQEVRIELTRLRWLRVVAAADGESRFSAERVSAARGSLDAQYLLHGNLKRVGECCRVTVELVNISTGANIWGERYDTPHRESLRAQHSIAEAVARAAAGAIVAVEQSCALVKKSDDLGAWESYQLGMWHMSSCDSNTIGTAHHYFQRTIELDPQFAAGYLALAWAQMMAASIYSKMTIADGCDLGEPLVMQAMTLDQCDPEARARLALVAFLRGDVGSAVEEAVVALAVKPDCASALGVKGAALISTGRRREGRAAIGRFLRLSPHDPVLPVRLTQVATSYYLDGDYIETARIAKQVTRRFPHHPFAYRWLAAALGQLGRVDEASAALDALRNKWPNSFEMYVTRQPPSYCSAEYKPLLAGLRKAGWKS